MLLSLALKDGQHAQQPRGDQPGYEHDHSRDDGPGQSGLIVSRARHLRY